MTTEVNSHETDNFLMKKISLLEENSDLMVFVHEKRDELGTAGHVEFLENAA